MADDYYWRDLWDWTLQERARVRAERDSSPQRDDTREPSNSVEFGRQFHSEATS